MKIKILKFGGTSLGSNQRIRHVIEIIKTHIDSLYKIVVVVSAKAGDTNEIISRISEIQKTNHILLDKNYDSAIASAENLSAGLLAIALKASDIDAIAMQGWQVPIITDSNFGKAKIINIENSKILSLLEKGIIPVITGFQGVTESNEISTLGRGGSDTSAAALAASLNAVICDIYTDVDGVYSGDPRIIKNAQKLKAISYEAMLEFADSGAKIITSRAVRICKLASIPINIKSSFEEIEGTLITAENKIMEKCKITGITNNSDIAVLYVKSQYKENIDIASQLSAESVHLISIIYHKDNTEIIIPLNEYKKCLAIIDKSQIQCFTRTDLSLISIIGSGIRYDCEIMTKILNFVKELDITVYSLISGDFKISILVEENHVKNFLIKLHEEFIENYTVRK
jgi:aspartate kinase